MAGKGDSLNKDHKNNATIKDSNTVNFLLNGAIKSNTSEIYDSASTASATTNGRIRSPTIDTERFQLSRQDASVMSRKSLAKRYK